MINSVKIVLMENIRNWRRLVRLANYEMQSQNNGTLLGFIWNFLNPALQILVYWTVFAIGLNTSPPRDDYPYIIWMVVGIIPWFYISGAMNGSSLSIFNYSGVLKRMNFPIALVPIKTVLAQFISHLWALLVVFAVIFVSGYGVSIYTLQLPYFLLCGIAFLSGYALLTSAVTVLFRDLQKILSSVIRLLFYITPVVWVQDSLPDSLRFILKFNPLAYIVDGYRESILYGNSLEAHWKQGLYFWAVTVGLFILGCNIHMKFRKRFIDLI
ncbi:ABC transporter permease [Anaerotruncus colihominis]|uniref:ABC transporter permease n=1 Tax=Anaerotruncus colihominis TaxID=169435 RepID=UPI00216BD2FD|nr:ABC transporter permease [Anaerotruncus colihominis]MCI8492608.1 ABC transporter permease [Anaerotruncus sp.]